MPPCLKYRNKLHYWRVWVQQKDSQTGDPAGQNSSQVFFHMIQIQLPPYFQRIPSAAW